MDEFDAMREVSDVFEALCAGQSREHVVSEMVTRGWTREEADKLVEDMAEKVSEFRAVGTAADESDLPPPDEPMRSFKLHRGKPLEDLTGIVRTVAAWIIVAEILAILAFSCRQM